MTTLLCIGLGSCARQFVADYGAGFTRIAGTARTAETVAGLAADRFGGARVEMIRFDGASVSDHLLATVARAETLLISAAPDRHGDPVLAALGDAIARAPHLASIVYLSTVGVYGDHGGAWIDEGAALGPLTERNRQRIEAENAWRRLGERREVPVALLRLAGIYGPGQNALVNLERGQARRIDKPGQVFNRIHVADIAQAIDAAIRLKADGAFNVADDEPSPPGDPIVFAARLLGIEPPPAIPFEEAKETLSPMGLSFYGECKRVKNDALKRALGVSLRYPTYREGLLALHEEMAAQALTPPDPHRPKP
jgi:nucleoside-diphosphate-sugar epimerase